MTQPALELPVKPLPGRPAISKNVILSAGILSDDWLSALSGLSNAISSGRVRVVKIAPDYLEKTLLQPEAWVQGQQHTWKRMLLVSGSGSDAVALKVFRPGGLLRRMYYALPGTDPYQKAYAFHRKLEPSPISSVKALAHGRVLTHGLLDFSFFAMERLEGVVPVADYLKHYLLRLHYSDAAKANVRRYAAVRLAEMHSHGFFHKDIKPYHCFAAASPADEPEETGPWRWVDLDRCKLHKPISVHERIINLYQFWRYILKPLGEDDSRAFLSLYLEHAPECRLRPEELEAKVLSHYEKRIARAVERGRLR